MDGIAKSLFTLAAIHINLQSLGSAYGLGSLVGHECGEVKQRASGVIRSPRLPAWYSQAVLCRWKIIAPENYNEIYIYIWYNGAKKVTYDLSHCFSDHLAIDQIIDGRKEKRARFCGKHGLFKTRTFGREVDVRFWASPTRRDDMSRRTSFKLLWFASKGCSSAIHGHQGIIQSPNYPNNYPADTYCTWRLSTPFKAGIIKLRFIKFDLQGTSPQCKKDFLIIKDSNKTMGRFCGKDTVEELNIEGNTAVFLFKSDKKRNFPGFKIEWSSEYQKYDDRGCGHSNFPPQPYHHRQRRFVAGKMAVKGTMPWLAQIITTSYTSSNNVREVSCGGALIGDKWVITAAHCIHPSKKLKLEVYLGGQEFKDLTAKKVGVKKVHMHPEYMGMLLNDVALLELEKEQTRSFTIQKICLPDKSKGKELFQEKTKCWMAGWGRRKDGQLSKSLLYSELKYLGHCLLRSNIICASSPDKERRIGPCDGDSGGPLFCQGSWGRFFIAGILTHGPRVCGTNQDYYADVSHYAHWIESVMKVDEVAGNKTE